MEESIVARIEEWDRREVGEGLVGLSKLADGEFSGAVDASGAWLFMLNGRVVGTSGGSVESLGPRDSLTAYTAPHPSLPLLFAMWERGGDTQGRYFTDDTQLEEVHNTLSSGSFTGYIELSENVHSGDYYVVYYGGRALFVAFVGAAERLVTGEEAFERASDEVGIYEINSVDLAVRDAPEPPEDATRAAGAGDEQTAPERGDPQTTGTDATRGTTTAAAAEAKSPGESDADDGHATVGEGEPSENAVEELRDPDPDAARDRIDSSDSGGRNIETGTKQPDPTDAPDPSSDEPAGTTDTDPEMAGDASGSAVTPRTGGPDDPVETTESDVESEMAGDVDGQGGPAGSTAETDKSGARDPPIGETDPGSPGSGGPNRNGAVAGGSSEADDGGAAWDDGHTVPALDPERTAVPADGANAETGRGSSSASETTTDTSGDVYATNAGVVASERVAELEVEIEELRGRLESLSEERDRFVRERDQAMSERDKLATERAELETQLEDLLAERTTAEADLHPSEALSKTDLFVRYDAKSQPTLSDAHEGNATPETVGANLRLETHTRFGDGATVNGEALESFLRNTLAYRFVTWLVGEFLFEIRDTGNEASLRDIYDALPEIDRVEFEGTVTSRNEDGEELSATFDVILRNKMGELIFLADLNEGRDPTDGDMMAELLDRSRRIAQTEDSVAGVFLITASFFDNEVHETVLEATKTGLLDRDSRTSFVKTSRNDGYHVCLVEARSDRFHLSRPDL
jgi:FtsZ-binding cell division protein ZapB